MRKSGFDWCVFYRKLSKWTNGKRLKRTNENEKVDSICIGFRGVVVKNVYLLLVDRREGEETLVTLPEISAWNAGWLAL